MQRIQKHFAGYIGFYTFIVPGVLEEVLSKDPHEDGG